MALISSAGWHCNCDEQEWSETDTGMGGGWRGGTWSPQYYGRIRMSYLLCSAIDIAHQIHPISCSCEHRDRDQHTLNPSPVFFGAPPNWYWYELYMHRGILIPQYEVFRGCIFFWRTSMNVLVPVWAQMRRWHFEDFWTIMYAKKCKIRKNYGDTTLSYSISRHDYQALMSAQQTTYWCIGSNTEILLAIILWRNHLLSTITSDLVLVLKQHP